jgi:transaldolase
MAGAHYIGYEAHTSRAFPRFVQEGARLMKFFIDSADVKEIRAAYEMGCVDGVTTNPSLIAKTGRPMEETIREICTIVDGPISAEAVTLTAPELIAEGRSLSKIHKNIVVKIPMTVEGMKAVKALTAEGIKTNVTLCFSANQALLAAKAGATYVSPFVGRLDDISEVGMELIRDIVTVYRNYGFKTQVLVASVRNPVHVLESARLGADVATVPFNVIQQLAQHPLTEAGLKKFLADWEKVPKPK